MKKNNITSFWNMKSVKLTKTKPFFQPKFIQPVKLNIYPKRTKQETRLINKNPFGDRDKDKVPNYFDCKPLNRKKQGFLYKPTAKVMKRYGPQIQPHFDRVKKLREADFEHIEELHEKWGNNPSALNRKLVQFDKQSQPERIGFFDLGTLPTIQVPQEYDTSTADDLQMRIIAEKGKFKGTVVTKKRSPTSVEIKTMYIVPEERGKGIGERVVAATFKNPKIKSVVGVAVPLSKGFSEKMGAEFGKGSREELEALKEHQEGVAINMAHNTYGPIAKHMPKELLPEFIRLNKNVIDASGTGFTLNKEEFERRRPQIKRINKVELETPGTLKSLPEIKYKKIRLSEKEELEKKAKDVFGTTTDFSRTDYILASGEQIPTAKEEEEYSHYLIQKTFPSKRIFTPDELSDMSDAIPSMFINKAQAMRIGYTDDAQINVDFSHKGITPEQREVLKKMVEEKKRIYGDKLRIYYDIHGEKEKGKYGYYYPNIGTEKGRSFDEESVGSLEELDMRLKKVQEKYHKEIAEKHAQKSEVISSIVRDPKEQEPTQDIIEESIESTPTENTDDYGYDYDTSSQKLIDDVEDTDEED